ncbi:MAG: phosphatase PAP2 family protein [Bacteroidetes bacterium]|nr:phosphatase PAP2 family protein [Bacteroidota bacterium]
MIEQIIHWDKSLLLFLNGIHSEFWDFIMFQISASFTWFAVYAFLIYFLIKNYKKRTIDIIIAVAILIAISDLTSVHLFKEIFHRLRPTHDPEIMDKVHVVYNYHGGLYGFVSSHAANFFALSFFFIQILGKKIKYLTPLLIIWASLISYSRIYLGVHFPLDVICGAILGILVGTGMGKLFLWYYTKLHSKI